MRATIVLLLLSLSLSLFACTEKESTGEIENEETYLLEHGFTISNKEIDYISRYSCGYKCEKLEYDIENVELLLFYGGYFVDDLALEKENQSFPTFSIILTNEKGHESTVKNVNEEFVSEKYRSVWKYSQEEGCTIITYNHSESLKIPSQFFMSEKGTIIITLESGGMYFASTTLYYAKNGSTVTLSSKEFK